MSFQLKKYFMQQKMMRKVIYSLIPIILASIYYFGWRSLLLIGWTTIWGCATEYIFEKKYGKGKVSEAVIVTSILFTLTLPPSTPFWVATLGIIFGVVFGKAVFGGFGKNVFNPALVARAFVYVSFPEPLTIKWSNVSDSFLGGFTRFTTATVDTISTATPMLKFRETGELTDYFNLFIGKISGSLGETSAILIILAAIYLIYTKTASWHIIASVITGFLGLSFILRLLGATSVPNPLFGILSGGILFGAVFMATDPISAAKTTPGKWIYGILIGCVTVIIRGYALFSGGIMFAVLIGNTFAPIIDEGVRYYKKSKKAKREKVIA
ncbi:MAG: RnfABCDGE type electron transport complex subunit D [Senegalia sp. (in: firmicutes)]|uniref:RnfABCDGE type electron transport complex subunit D n=2 Tax=Senegalia sp. (in: firmicutes) TaxID=1924098 RepID=UPI003F97AC4E